MKKLIILMILLMLTVSIFANQTDFVKANNNFSIKLFKQNIKEDNIVISPFSAWTALGMLSEGAKRGTKREFNKVLFKGKFSNQGNLFKSLSHDITNNKSLQLNIANSIWVEEYFSIKDAFRGKLKRLYDSEVYSFDVMKPVESSQKLNRWVEKHTNNLIKDIVSPDSFRENTKLILANAIYFKASWINSFEKRANYYDVFHAFNGEEIKTEMMQNKENYKIFFSKEVTFIELPYRGNAVMQIFMPEKKDIFSFINDIKLRNIEEISKKANFRKVKLSLPKFKLESKFQLKDSLQKLGLKKAFSTKANFKEISDRDLFVNSVIQKAFVNVDENGTEAAAATVIEMRTTSIPMEDDFITIKINRPFMFIIKENKTNTILFMGLKLK